MFSADTVTPVQGLYLENIWPILGVIGIGIVVILRGDKLQKEEQAGRKKHKRKRRR